MSLLELVNSPLAGIFTNLLGGVSKVVESFRGATLNDVKLAELNAALQESILKYKDQDGERLLQVALKQAELNAIAANNGKLGWRNWLCSGLTIIFLTFLSLLFLMVLVAWFSTAVLGNPVDQAWASVNAFPYEHLNWLWGALTFLLGGLYTTREIGKYKLAQVKVFNEEAFFNKVRELSGPISSHQFQILKEAIKAAQN